MTLTYLDLDLDVFAGPFDLLLTLILREEVDLLEVDLAEVVITYIDHLERTGDLDLEAATESFQQVIASHPDDAEAHYNLGTLYLRRKNLGDAAEAAVEVGRLLYLLGRRSEGLQKFDEAIEADGDRDQTYIDVVAFLVQQGETDAAISVYHRALSRPGRAVSEYVKVYTSLWVLDLSRRTTKLLVRM